MTSSRAPRSRLTLALSFATVALVAAGVAAVSVRPSATAAAGIARPTVATPQPAVASTPVAPSPTPSVTTAPPTPGPSSAPASDAVQVSTTTPIGTSVPAEFLGLSVEAQSVADGTFSAKTAGLVDLLKGLHPGFLRVGASTGDSAPLTSQALAQLTQLSAAADLPIVLQLPFRPDNVAAATTEAITAARDLGQGLEAFEIGNEPDSYAVKGIRRAPWTYASLVRERDAFRASLARAGLRVPLWGPDDSGSGWLATTVAEHERPYVVITQHFYPLSNCRPPTPTVRLLLSDDILAKEQSEAALLAQASRAARLPVVVDETNSVSCYGGLDGVSNTAASALWALDYGLVMARAGVGALAFHVPLSGCAGYSPLCLVGSGATRHWIAAPEYPGLATLSSLEGDRFTTTSLTSVHHHLRTYSLISPANRAVLVALDLDPSNRGTAKLLWQHSAATAAITQAQFGTADYASLETTPITTGTTAPPVTPVGALVKPDAAAGAGNGGRVQRAVTAPPRNHNVRHCHRSNEPTRTSRGNSAAEARVLQVDRRQRLDLSLGQRDSDPVVQALHGGNRNDHVVFSPEMPLLQQHVCDLAALPRDDQPLHPADLAVGCMHGLPPAY